MAHGNPTNRNIKKNIPTYFSFGKVALTPYLFAPRREHALGNESRKLICATYPSADHLKMNPIAEFQGFVNPKEIP